MSTPPNPLSTLSRGEHMARGSAWIVALRWSVRATGLISTLILARLLTPADFGIVAMAMLVVGMLEVLSRTGQDMALIRLTAPTREHYDTAWTISIAIGIVLAVLIFAVAPLTTAYFHEPRAVWVIRCLALRTLLAGFENIGVVDFRRELDFSRNFRYGLYQRLSVFVVTLVLALAWGNYWALVAGILTGSVASLWLSFWMHPFRPRLSTARMDDILSFSIWTLVKHVGLYLAGKLDEFVVGGMGGVPGLPGASVMGQYNVAADIASAPTDEIAGPMITALFPVMATIQHEPAAIRELYLRVLSWLAVICCATSVGVALIAHEMVAVLLGNQWLAIAPLLAWLSLSQGILAFGSAVYVLFDVSGQPRLSARMQWVRLALLALVLIPLSRWNDLGLIVIGRFVVVCIVTPSLFVAQQRVLPMSLGQLASCLWRPAIAALAMTATVYALDSDLTANAPVRLAANIVAGVTSYAAMLLALWRLAGMPAGPEGDIVASLRRFGRYVGHQRAARHPPTVRTLD
jgi:lipopolysaccharide exporter